MKKMMIMLLAVIATFAVNAATVSWQVMSVYTPTPSALGPGSTSGAPKMSKDAGLTIQLLWNNDGGDTWTEATTGALTADGAMAKTTLWTQAQAEANRDSTTKNAYFKAVFTYVDSEGGTYTKELLSGAKGLGNIASAAVNVTFNMNNQTWDYTPAGTPEPTSGLLLLVGGAMLALRRKQK